MIAVEGTIFAFVIPKKYDLSLLPISGRVFDSCRAFDRFASVDAHLCWHTEDRRKAGVGGVREELGAQRYINNLNILENK
jgi:hypothetical protein